MPQIELGTPAVVSFGGDSGGTGQVVGTDPWGDNTDATYASGWTRKDLTSSFEHIRSSVPAVGVDPVALTISLRMSATASLSNPAMIVRAVINLYGPGSTTGVDPPLNITDGINPVYVTLPTYDGTIYEIPVSLYDWNTETPATSAQVVAYFASGGTLQVQPNINGGGTGTAEVKIHRLAFTWASTTTYRRNYPRDDGLAGGAGRNWPRPKSIQSSNRTSGYL